MNDKNIKNSEFERLLSSIAASQKGTNECLDKLTQSIVEIKEYIIHNDYRHDKTESEIKGIQKDITSMLELMAQRKSMWDAFRTGRIAAGVIITGALATAGGALYNYIVKPQPVINQHKEQPKVAVKPVTKDLIK